MSLLSNLWKKITGSGSDVGVNIYHTVVTEESLEEQMFPFPSTADMAKELPKKAKKVASKKQSKPRVSYKWLNEVIDKLFYNPMLAGEIVTIPVPSNLVAEQIRDTVNRKVRELFACRVDGVTGKITFKHRGAKLVVQIEGVGKAKAKGKK